MSLTYQHNKDTQMNSQQEIQLQRLEAQVRHLTQQLNNVNFAIHSLRSSSHTPPLQRPPPIPALNPRWFGDRSPNPYAGACVSSQHQPLPWEMPHGYSPELRDPTRPPGFIKSDTMSHVFFYEQDCYVLSNFSAFTLQWGGEDFDTAEAAYHWEKFPTHPEIQKQIRDARSAHEAYQIAAKNKAHRRPDWDLVKVGIMKEILRAKVDQHEYVRRKLLETGDRILIEDSWRDDFWGWGPNRRGQNILGRLWMEIRTELQNYKEAPKKPDAMTPSKLPVIVMATEDWVKANCDLVAKLVNGQRLLKHDGDCPGKVRAIDCTCDQHDIIVALSKVIDIQTHHHGIIGNKPGPIVIE